MNVVWFVSRLDQKGGGERFVLEGVLAAKKQGAKIQIVTDSLGPEASFDGKYDLSNVVDMGCGGHFSDSYKKKFFSKVKSFFKLASFLRSNKIDLLVCQSEYDAIRLYILSFFLGFKYRVFIFGQMFQFVDDYSKYALVFRKNLMTIRDSRPGYAETVLVPAPRLNFKRRVFNELVSFLRYLAVRRADKIFTLSNQVKWEVSLLFRRNASVLTAAFNESFIDTARLNSSSKQDCSRFISVCRLVEKKRVDVIVKAFGLATIDATLTIIGTGYQKEAIAELIRQSPRRDRIRFLGSVDDIRLAEELTNADCFISMDVGDYDISVVEAMGRGLRVLTSTDFDDSIFGSNFQGLKRVVPNDIELSKAMNNINEMAKPTASNIPILENLTWESLAKKLLEN